MSINSNIEIIWGNRLLDEGFTSIPNILIRNYRKLDIQHGEWGFICTLLTYKHDARDPYPSRRTLAEHLCCSERQIDKWVKSLRDKGLIRTGRRRNVHNKQWDNTVYNFKPLLDACLRLVGDEPLPTSDNYAIEWDDEPSVVNPRVPEVPNPCEPEVRKPREPEVRTENNNIKITNKKDDDDKRAIESLLNDKGITVSKATITRWKKLANYETIIKAIESALNRDGITNVIGYITKILQDGIEPIQATAKTSKSKRTSRKVSAPKTASDLPPWIADKADGVTQSTQTITEEERQQAAELLAALEALN